MTSRRRIALAGVGAVAALAGARLAWQHQAGPAVPPPGPAGSDPTPDALWGLQFDRPEGGTLALASFRGKPLLLNFWATWCPPCVKEMPELDRFHQAWAPQGWQVLGLAIDGPTPVRNFLARVKVGFPIGLAGLDGTELVRSLGNVGGGLPFSVLVGANGRVLRRKLGGTSYDELEGWARSG